MEKVLSESQYEQQIEKAQTTILKFTASWCPDCRNMDRFLDEVIAEHDDKAWLEIDAEQFQDIAEANVVRGIPSLLVFRNGEKIAHLHSKFAKTPNQVREFLDTLA